MCSLSFLETFKRGQTKCSEALLMSDINTDSELDNVGSKKSTKTSASVGPFPSIDFDDAPCFSSNNEDSDIEMIKKNERRKLAN